jgi:hypothetical protein
MQTKTNSGIVEISLLLASTALLLSGFLLCKIELGAMKRERTLQKSLRVEKTLRGKMLNILIDYDRLDEPTLDIPLKSVVSEEHSKLETFFSQNRLPNWTQLLGRADRIDCRPHCAKSSAKLTNSMHIHGTAQIGIATIQPLEKVDHVIISTWGSLLLDELVIIGNSRKLRVEILVRDDIHLGILSFQGSSDLELLLHSSLGKVELKQSNLLGCSKVVSANERLLLSKTAPCSLPRNANLWPAFRILGESLEKF